MNDNVWLMIAGMTLVTYTPRVLPLIGLSQTIMPQWLTRWLNLIPPAILASLLSPAIFAPEGTLELLHTNFYLIAAIPTLLVAWKTRSLALTILVGMSVMAILNNLYP